MGDSIYKGYDTVAGHWVLLPEGLLGELDDLTDVETPAPGNNEVLTYETATHLWKNKPTPGGADPTAIHDNVAGEIAAVAPKGSPTGSDFLLIEDAADTNKKKCVTISSLPYTLLLTAALPANVTKAVAGVGIAVTAARADHKHDITTAIPGSIAAGDIAAEGAATSLARSDHRHGSPASWNDADAIHDNVAGEIAAILLKGLPSTSDLLLIEDAGAGNVKKHISIGSLPFPPITSTAPVNVTKSVAQVGFGTEAARNDHKHDITTAIPNIIAAGVAANEGTATSLARSDHRHGTPASWDDTYAIHDNVKSEISAVALKAAPTISDFLLIEDAADSENKKHITIGSLPGGVDPTAIHDNVASEISAIVEKTSLVSTDMFVIEDSAAANAKKRVLASTLSKDLASDAHGYGNHTGTSPYICFIAGMWGNAVLVGASGFASDYMYAVPFIAPKRGATIAYVKFEVTTYTAPTNLRIGIYIPTSGVNLYPGALVSGGSTIAIGSVGVKQVTFSVDLIPGQMYYIIFLGNTDFDKNSYKCIPETALSHMLGITTSLGGVSAEGNIMWRVAQAYGALPDPFTAGGILLTYSDAPVLAMAMRYSA